MYHYLSKNIPTLKLEDVIILSLRYGGEGGESILVASLYQWEMVKLSYTRLLFVYLLQFL